MKTVVLAAALLSAAPAAAATTVDANSSGTSIGTVVAGKTYKFTTTGIVDLVGGPIGEGGTFNLDADGVPTQPVTYPGYDYFNPSGSTIADGQSGPLPGTKFGALIGTLNGGTSYFRIGSSLRTSFATGGEIFARINDINANNSGSFSVTVTAVPEPAAWGLMIVGFGVVGGAMRRRSKVRTTVAFG